MTKTKQRLLIHENTQAITQFEAEIQSRISILNRIPGLGREEIENITSSVASIEKFILDRQLAANPVMRQQYEAGAQGLQYVLPPELEELKKNLTAWHGVRMDYRSASKFQYLTFDAGLWSINTEEVESYLEKRSIKVYLSDEKSEEYEFLLKLAAYFKEHQLENNQLAASSFLIARLEPKGHCDYVPSWRYLKSVQ